MSGWYTTGLLTPIVSLTPGAYQPITPIRLRNTRNRGAAGKLKAQTKLSFDATNALDTLPTAGIDSVVLNVTATNVSARGHLRVYPDGPAMPFASNLNFDSGATVANVVTVHRPTTTGWTSSTARSAVPPM